MVWNEAKQAYYKTPGTQKMYGNDGQRGVMGRWKWAHDGTNCGGWVDLKADGTLITSWNNGTRWRFEVNILD